jgi:hypothetical protein
MFGCSPDKDSTHQIRKDVKVESEVKIEILSDVVVVGRNPELSDVSNPDGLVFDTVYDIVAVFPSGKRFLVNVTYDRKSKEQAQKQARGLRFALSLGAGIPVFLFKEIRPVYGSPEYVAQNCEETLAREERTAR